MNEEVTRSSCVAGQRELLSIGITGDSRIVEATSDGSIDARHAALQFHRPPGGWLSSQGAQDGNRVAQVSRDHLHGENITERSRHGSVSGTEVDLRIAQLQLTRALIVIDGERTRDRHGTGGWLQSRFQIEHRSGLDASQARLRDLPG